MYTGQTMRKEWQELYDMSFPVHKYKKKIIRTSNVLKTQTAYA